MEKTLRQFIAELQKVREDLQDKPVIIIAPNGLEFEPKAKFRATKPLDYSADSVSHIVVEY